MSLEWMESCREAARAAVTKWRKGKIHILIFLDEKEGDNDGGSNEGEE